MLGCRFMSRSPVMMQHPGMPLRVLSHCLMFFQAAVKAAVEPPDSGNRGTSEGGPSTAPRVLILLRTVIWRSTGLDNKLAGQHHRVPIASRAAA